MQKYGPHVPPTWITILWKTINSHARETQFHEPVQKKWNSVNLKTVQFYGCQVKMLSVYVTRVCEKSTSLCRKMHSNRHLREGCFVQKQMKWSHENHKITHFRLMSRAIVHIFSVSWLASSLSLTSNTFTSWKFLLALEREHNYWNEHLFQKHSKTNPKEAYVLKEFKMHEPMQENGCLTTNIHRRKGIKTVWYALRQKVCYLCM